ncbi:MAG TPA: fatty acyl-AMP ligase [Roseomonas sp.]|jgi:fatty-acyl-CoA synthase
MTAAPAGPGGLSKRFADFTTITEALDHAAAGEDGACFHDARGGVDRALAYRELRDEAQGMARRLAGLGFGRGDRLGLVAETAPAFLIAFYACQYAGLIPCPLPHTAYLGGRAAYEAQLAGMLGAARAAAIILPASIRGCGDAAAAATGARVLAYEDLASLPDGDVPLPGFGPEDAAYIQYSSGSTAQPKGVLISQRAICANAGGILRHGLRLRPGDRAFSWLPFYHDMGLVGFALAPMFGRCSVDYLAAGAFARRPALWLQLMAAKGSTITYAPSFGYRLAAQRFRSNGEALDLSRLRVAGIGGDMVRADVLAEFADALAATGFRAEAFLPSYGMAEATLAVTFADPGGVVVDQSRGDPRGYVVCGRPLPGHALIVVDAAGVALPDGEIGHIWLRGPSLMQGYFANPAATAAVMRRDGFMDSGDLGYLRDGRIVVTGRAKDVILQRGRNIWPEDVEWAVERLPPLLPGDAVAFGIEADGEEVLVTLIQCGLTDTAAREGLRARAAAAISESVGVAGRIVLVPPRSLPFTSSGKLARGLARSRYLAENALPAVTPILSSPETAAP